MMADFFLVEPDEEMLVFLRGRLLLLRDEADPATVLVLLRLAVLGLLLEELFAALLLLVAVALLARPLEEPILRDTLLLAGMRGEPFATRVSGKVFLRDSRLLAATAR